MHIKSIAAALLMSIAAVQAQESTPASQTTTTLTETQTMYMTVKLARVSTTTAYGVSNTTFAAPTGTGATRVPTASPTTDLPASITSNPASPLNANLGYAGLAGLVAAVLL